MAITNIYRKFGEKLFLKQKFQTQSIKFFKIFLANPHSFTLIEKKIHPSKRVNAFTLESGSPFR
jgi:hypothetical protein